MSIEIIKNYQLNPSKENEQKVLDAYAPYIKANVNKWAGVVPDTVLNAYGKHHALEAFKTYNEEKGSVNTHLYNHISQLSRLIYQHQNAAGIPENLIQKIGLVNTATKHLTDELGREPNLEELSDHLSLPKAHVARIIKNQRADFINDSDVDDFQNAVTNTETADRIFSYRNALDEQKKQQFDALTGYNGTTPLSPQQFGHKFKLKPYEVSRLKLAFAKGLK